MIFVQIVYIHEAWQDMYSPTSVNLRGTPRIAPLGRRWVVVVAGIEPAT